MVGYLPRPRLSKMGAVPIRMTLSHPQQARTMLRLHQKALTLLSQLKSLLLNLHQLNQYQPLIQL